MDIPAASIAATGDYAEGTITFAAAVVDWTLSTRAADLPDGTDTGAARQIWVDGEPVCDFSGGAGLHTAMYREILAGDGHTIEDAADGVRLAERIRRAALSRPGVPPPRQAAATGPRATR